LKAETVLDSEVVNGYVVLLKFIMTVAPRWAGFNNKFYSDINGKEEFALRIHKDNVFKCMRLSVTDVISKCACHGDKYNLYDPLFSAVLRMLVVQKVNGWLVRIAINAQSRKAIDKSLLRMQIYRPILNMVVTEYKLMPDERKSVSRSLLLGCIGGRMKGFRCVKNPCSMDSMSFYQPLIHYYLLLVNHFSLSFPETVGLVLRY
jgi:hypothetical protein